MKKSREETSVKKEDSVPLIIFISMMTVVIGIAGCAGAEKTSQANVETSQMKAEAAQADTEAAPAEAEATAAEAV